MTSFPDFSIALRLSLRARFPLIAFWLTVVVIGASWMAAQFSGRQPATVALDVGLSVIRLALPVVAIILLQEVLSQEFARKIFLTSMTYPRPRYRFLLGRFAAVCSLLIVLLVVLTTLLAAAVALIGQSYAQGTPVALDARYGITVAFMVVDVVVIAAVATLLAVVAVTPSFVLIGTLGFMLIARSFSSVVALLSQDRSLVRDGQAYQSSLNALGYIVPDLAALDVRMIALYGQWSFLPSDWPARVTASVIYAFALVAAATWALNRKRFA